MKATNNTELGSGITILDPEPATYFIAGNDYIITCLNKSWAFSYLK